MAGRTRKPPTKRKGAVRKSKPRTTTRTESKVSFEISVPVRNVTPAQAAKIKADARKKLTGAKFKAIGRRRK